MMTVEEKPDVTYNDVGGCKEQIEKMREVVELPMLHPEKFVKLGIDPPKGVLCYSPPGTGKTLLARAVANRTDACFIRVIGSELVQKYVGEDARMVRELFQMAHSKTACIVFFDEVDAIGGARFDDGVGGDNEVQHTMLEIVNSTGADIRSVCTEAGMYAIRARRKTVTEKDFLDANEPEERLLNRFRREVMRAGVIQECKRRRFFENKQEEKKRKSREAAKRKSRSRRFQSRFQPQNKPDVAPTKKEEDNDNWNLPEVDAPYISTA
ncbi:hypothetical protein JHK82_044150 [Glycine max]|nr:hypothetical protein JHK85_045106 [Glycine max]KAG5099098.1 hypothetical protein JHK82_044150 [Glycine max]